MNLIRELLARSTADGSRSNALKHLQWVIGLLLGFLIAPKGEGISDWIQVAIFVLLCIAFIAYFITHFYFMFKNPDALRSEKFTIQKMAIERGIFGDTLVGFTEGFKIPNNEASLIEGKEEKGEKEEGKE